MLFAPVQAFNRRNPQYPAQLDNSEMDGCGETRTFAQPPGRSGRNSIKLRDRCQIFILTMNEDLFPRRSQLVDHPRGLAHKITFQEIVGD